MGMTYETGKNFEKVQALLEEHEKKINYLMLKLSEKAAAKKATVKPVIKEEEEDEAIEEIVQQELTEQPQPKAKRVWGKKPIEEIEESEESEANRIL